MHHHSPSPKLGLILYLFFSFASHITSPGHKNHQSAHLLHPPCHSSCWGHQHPFSSCLFWLCPCNPCYQKHCQSDLSKHKEIFLLFYLCSPLLGKVPNSLSELTWKVCYDNTSSYLFSFFFSSTLLPPAFQTHQPLSILYCAMFLVSGYSHICPLWEPSHPRVSQLTFG